MKVKLIIIIIISVFALGFIIGFVMPTNQACTKRGCPCENVSGERPCNSCSISNQVFTTGILNVIQQCGASEIVTCENNTQIDTRIDLENKQCTLDWYIFGFNLKYINSNPEEPVSNVIN